MRFWPSKFSPRLLRIGRIGANRDRERAVVAQRLGHDLGMARTAQRQGHRHVRRWARDPLEHDALALELVNVEALRNAAGHVDAMIVVDGGADDNEIVNDGGWRSHVIPAGIVLENFAEANLAVLAEIGTGSARGSVDGDETGILRGLEDAAVAKLLG